MNSVSLRKYSSDIGKVKKTLMDFYALEFMIRSGLPSVWGDDIRETLKMLLDETKYELMDYLKQSLTKAIAHQYYLLASRKVERYLRTTIGYEDIKTEEGFEKNPDFEDKMVSEVETLQYVRDTPKYFNALPKKIQRILNTVLETALYIRFYNSYHWEILSADDYETLNPELVSFVDKNFDLISELLSEKVPWWEKNLQVFKMIINMSSYSIN